MLVFGDLATQENARRAIATWLARFRRAMKEPAGVCRHTALVESYIETSRLAQACVDAEFAQTKEDSLAPPHAAAIAALRAMAALIGASWKSVFRYTGPLDEAALEEFVACAPEAVVDARVAEGFAFYALYPETCFDASLMEEAQAVVIGIRSIGMALAPLLAEELDASLCFTVRPTGHPFARDCQLAPDLREAVRARRNARFYIIDEGPGLSGSSFMAVADALAALGVTRARLVFVASNASGPGNASSQRTRDRWSAASKHILDAAPVISRALASCKIIRDMSGGLWRDGHANATAPTNRHYERQKFLVENDDGLWLAKFVGLGSIGNSKERIARSLSEAGFAPQASAARHGFLLQRWIGDARAVTSAPRNSIILRLAEYIAFRARHLPPLATGGASMDDLFVMAKHNCARVAVSAADTALAAFAPMLDELAAQERPIASDNRMQAWEWVVDPSGAILKCDGADHCAGHDLVGCRDAAWDVAGAIVEFALDDHERARLVASLDARGVEISPRLLEFFLIAYCAFQMGAAQMAVNAHARWPDDANRWRVAMQSYATMLRAFTPSPARSR